MCVALALVHSSLNPGMTDCQGRVSSFLPQAHTAHRAPCLENVSSWQQLCSHRYSYSHTQGLSAQGSSALVLFRQHLCGIFPTFQKAHRSANKCLFFFWTCHKDLLPAMILLLCSGNSVDKHSSGGWCTLWGQPLLLLPHRSVFRTTEQSSSQTLQGLAVLKMT